MSSRPNCAPNLPQPPVSPNELVMRNTRLWRMRECGQLCDVTLVVGGVEFPCHRAVLAAAGEYFSILFTGPYADAQRDAVPLEGVDPSAFQQVLSFAYTGACTFDDSTVTSVLAAADLFSLDALRELCGEYLLHRLDVDSCLVVWRIAEATSMTRLCDECLSVALREFPTLAFTSAFQDLEPDRLAELIGSDLLRARTERDVFEAVLRWAREPISSDWSVASESSVEVKGATATATATTTTTMMTMTTTTSGGGALAATAVATNSLVPTKGRNATHGGLSLNEEYPRHKWATSVLLPRVRFPLLSPHYLQQTVERCPLMRDHRELILEAYRFHALGDRVALDLQSERTRRRQANADCMLVIGGSDGYQTSSSVDRYTPSTGEWDQLLPLRSVRSECSAVLLGDHVYVIGGRDDHAATLVSVERLSLHPLESGSGRESKSASVERRRAATPDRDIHRLQYIQRHRDNNDLRLREGDDELNSSSSADEDDVHDHDDVHASGALSTRPSSSSVASWEQVMPLGTARQRAGVTTHNGFIYVVGGEDGIHDLETVERYLPHRGKWEAIEPMLSTRTGCAAVTLHDCIYAIGGWNGHALLSTVERYVVATGRWEAVAPMSVPRDTCGAVVLHNRIYVVGGWDGETDLDVLECYDPASNTWSMLSPMMTPRSLMAVAVLDEHIFVCGGKSTGPLNAGCYMASAERFSPITNSWEYIASMAEPRGHVGGTPAVCK